MTLPEELDPRARLLRAAVGFALVPPSETELDASFIDHRCRVEAPGADETTPL